jgi:putative hydrolase of the HAD superfamily
MMSAVFFDAVGTLIYPQPSAPAVYQRVGITLGSRYSETEIARRFAAAFLQEEELDRGAGWRTSEERERQRWQKIVGQVLDDVSDPEACFHELYTHFSRPDSWRCDPEAAEVLDELAKRGYVLGLASNYDHRLRAVLAGFPELRGLGHLVISAEVGWRKPARPFFDAIQEKVRLPAARILHVGDDPENDFAGAVAAGLQAVMFDPKSQGKVFPGRRIRRLVELLDCLVEFSEKP